jgi:hypothetical protein
MLRLPNSYLVSNIISIKLKESFVALPLLCLIIVEKGSVQGYNLLKDFNFYICVERKRIVYGIV